MSDIKPELTPDAERVLVLLNGLEYNPTATDIATQAWRPTTHEALIDARYRALEGIEVLLAAALITADFVGEQVLWSLTSDGLRLADDIVLGTPIRLTSADRLLARRALRYLASKFPSVAADADRLHDRLAT